MWTSVPLQSHLLGVIIPLCCVLLCGCQCQSAGLEFYGLSRAHSRKDVDHRHCLVTQLSIWILLPPEETSHKMSFNSTTMCTPSPRFPAGRQGNQPMKTNNPHPCQGVESLLDQQAHVDEADTVYSDCKTAWTRLSPLQLNQKEHQVKWLKATVWAASRTKLLIDMQHTDHNKQYINNERDCDWMGGSTTD